MPRPNIEPAIKIEKKHLAIVHASSIENLLLTQHNFKKILTGFPKQMRLAAGPWPGERRSGWAGSGQPQALAPAAGTATLCWGRSKPARVSRGGEVGFPGMGPGGRWGHRRRSGPAGAVPRDNRLDCRLPTPCPPPQSCQAGGGELNECLR